MKGGMKDAAIAVVAAAAVVAVVFSGLYAYSGIWPPFSIVESGSMQHSDRSTFITIDTGDAVVVRSPDKVEIKTYVDGYKENYKKFGDYGDVIVYERTTGNPIIHRAVIWLDWNPVAGGDGFWSAPSLEGFPESGWSNDGGHDYMHMTGTLTFYGYGFSSQVVSLNLNSLPEVSGYVTKGDNNPVFDNGPGGLVPGLISKEMILYVAGFSIPWLGIIKIYLSGDQYAISQIPANSVPEMIAMTVAVISILAALFAISGYISWYRHKDEE